MKQSLTQNTVRSYMAIVAILLIAISVALFKFAAFGIDPFQCFMAGMANVFSFLSFSTMYFVVSVLLFVAMFIWGRKCIGFATFVNIACIGVIIEYFGKFLVFVFGTPSFGLRLVIFVVGSVLLMFSSALYFTADKGVSIYDFVALTMADKKIMSFRFCRIFTDSVCVIIGFFLGVNLGTEIGVGTIITAFLMGPVISLFREKVTDPFLARFPIEKFVES